MPVAFPDCASPVARAGAAACHCWRGLARLAVSPWDTTMRWIVPGREKNTPSQDRTGDLQRVRLTSLDQGCLGKHTATITSTLSPGMETPPETVPRRACAAEHTTSARAWAQKLHAGACIGALERSLVHAACSGARWGVLVRPSTLERVRARAQVRTGPAVFALRAKWLKMPSEPTDAYWCER